MPCIPIPSLPFPNLPEGISLTVPLPTIPSIGVQFPCCILPPLMTPKIPLALPPLTVSFPFVQILRAAFEVIEEYEALIPLQCPRS